LIIHMQGLSFSNESYSHLSENSTASFLRTNLNSYRTFFPNIALGGRVMVQCLQPMLLIHQAPACVA
jgi:hypothetical protein